MTLGQVLYRYRCKRGLAIAAVARKANISRRTIQMLERDEHELRISTLLALAEGYDIDADELMIRALQQARGERVTAL